MRPSRPVRRMRSWRRSWRMWSGTRPSPPTRVVLSSTRSTDADPSPCRRRRSPPGSRTGRPLFRLCFGSGNYVETMDIFVNHTTNQLEGDAFGGVPWHSEAMNGSTGRAPAPRPARWCRRLAVSAPDGRNPVRERAGKRRTLGPPPEIEEGLLCCECREA